MGWDGKHRVDCRCPLESSFEYVGKKHQEEKSYYNNNRCLIITSTRSNIPQDLCELCSGLASWVCSLCSHMAPCSEGHVVTAFWVGIARWKSCPWFWLDARTRVIKSILTRDVTSYLEADIDPPSFPPTFVFFIYFASPAKFTLPFAVSLHLKSSWLFPERSNFRYYIILCNLGGWSVDVGHCIDPQTSGNIASALARLKGPGTTTHAIGSVLTTKDSQRGDELFERNIKSLL